LEKIQYLGTVHMDIAFEDCLYIGGCRCALILVDQANRYNWAFGLKNLSFDSILSAMWLICSATSSLAQGFFCDCDVKLFGTTIREYLFDNQSKVVAALAKQQLSHG
jgi:hypothetical protein